MSSPHGTRAATGASTHNHRTPGTAAPCTHAFALTPTRIAGGSSFRRVLSYGTVSLPGVMRQIRDHETPMRRDLRHDARSAPPIGAPPVPCDARHLLNRHSETDHGVRDANETLPADYHATITKTARAGSAKPTNRPRRRPDRDPAHTHVRSAASRLAACSLEKSNHETHARP